MIVIRDLRHIFVIELIQSFQIFALPIYAQHIQKHISLGASFQLGPLLKPVKTKSIYGTVVTLF